MNNLEDFIEINGNFVHPTSVVYWDRINIGTGNILYPYVCIGTDAQHMRESSTGIIEIGNNNVFHPHSCITMPTKISNKTKIGDNCYFMSNSMIHHDCVIEDNVTISNNCVLSGHVHCMQGSILGLNVNVHQWQVIGSYSMLGMGTVVTKKSKITPGNIFVGTPARLIKPNKVGLERNKIDQENLDLETRRYADIHEELNK